MLRSCSSGTVFEGHVVQTQPDMALDANLQVIMVIL